MENLIVFFRRHQKLLFVLALLTAVIFFIYTLCFSTDLYKLSYFMDVNNLRPNNYVPGSRIYLEAQNFNRLILDLSIVLIVLVIILFLFLGHRRRIYYLSNIISISLYSTANIVLSILLIFKISYYKNAFLNGVDFEKYHLVATSMNLLDKYSNSTFWLDVGYIVSALMLISAILMLVNLLLRLKAIKNEKVANTFKSNNIINKDEAFENKFTSNFMDEVQKVVAGKEDTNVNK